MEAWISRGRPLGQVPRRPGRGLTLALVVGLGAGVAPAGCDCAPARSKPWRLARDPLPGSSPPASPVLVAEAEHAAGLAARDDTLRVQLDADPGGLVPLARPTEWSERIAVGPVFETLLGCAQGPAGTTYHPGLAARWSIEQGGRVVALELRDGVTFHDGSRFTSVDAQFSLDAVRDPRTDADALRPLFDDVSSVELAGPRGLRIWLHRPSGYVLRGLCSAPILPAAIYQRAVHRNPRAIGTGPYQLAAATEHVVRLAAYPGYWGKHPAIANLAFVREADDARALSAARAGELDLVPKLAEVHQGQASEAGLARRFVPLALAPPVFEYLALAADRPPLDDVRVRRAISLALDRDALVAKGHAGLARAIVAPVWPGGPASGAAPVVPAVDPAAAARLLDSAGWIDGDHDGVRERGGQRLQLVALVGDQPSLVRARVLETLRVLGFFVEERAGSPAVLLNRLQSGQFQLGFVTWRGLADGDLTALLASGGRQNFGRVSDREIDRLLEAMRATWAPAERASLATALGARIAEVQPIIPLTAEAPVGLVHRRVRGVRVWDGWLALPELSFAPDADVE